MNFEKHKVLNELRKMFGISPKTYKQEDIVGYKKWLKKYDSYKFDKPSNETFGICVEKTLCEIFCLKYPYHIYTRGGPINKKMTKMLKKICENENIFITKYIGTLNKQTDFILCNSKTLSVKTNIKGYKICPQNIGQCTKERFDEIFNIKMKNNYGRKVFIINNISMLIKKYIDNTFICDFLLWFYNENGKFHYKVIRKESLHLNFTDDNSWTFTRNQDEWNESSTVKYSGISLGEFQIHNNRNCVKFRFNMKNLIKFI